MDEFVDVSAAEKSFMKLARQQRVKPGRNQIREQECQTGRRQARCGLVSETLQSLIDQTGESEDAFSQAIYRPRH